MKPKLGYVLRMRGRRSSMLLLLLMWMTSQPLQRMVSAEEIVEEEPAATSFPIAGESPLESTESLDSKILDVTTNVSVDAEDEAEDIATETSLITGDTLIAAHESQDTGDKPPTTTADPPVGTNEPPVVTNEPPVITNEPPVITNEPPVNTNEPPAITDEPPVITNEPPVNTNEPPAITNEPPVNTNEPAVSTNEPQVSTDDLSAITNVPPITTKDPPVTTKEPPVNTDEPPVSTNEPPALTNEPSATTNKPPVTTTRATAITEEPPVNTDEPPATTNEPSVSTPHVITNESQANTSEPSHKTSEPPDITNTPTTTGMTCGENAEVEDGECVCKSGWISGPDDLGSHCNCPDLCSLGSTCPLGSTCYHLTCNVVSCMCISNQHYDPATNTCRMVCEVYGDALCGLSSNKKCESSKTSAEASSPSSGASNSSNWISNDEFTCVCKEGFRMSDDGTCRDLNECELGEEEEGRPPCEENEECVNTKGNFTCQCLPGYLRNFEGVCVNVNECGSLALHDCEQVCEDVMPPAKYICSCYPGYTFNATTRICVINDGYKICECGPSEMSVCMEPSDGGELECHPRPGYRSDNGSFYRVKECEGAMGSWCGRDSVCSEDEVGAKCSCRNGYTNLTNGECVPIQCPVGTILSDASCVDPCSTISCVAPLTCFVSESGLPECQCMSECQALLKPEIVNTSIYYGSFVMSAPADFDTGQRLKDALEPYFGENSIEVLEIKPQKKKRKKRRLTRGLEDPKVSFSVKTKRSNMTSEVGQVIRGTCRSSNRTDSGTCILPGGLPIKRETIEVEIKDPCRNEPCPDLMECQEKSGVSGRHICTCLPGFQQRDSNYGHGYCLDVNECSNESESCPTSQECINTPGSFVCRSHLPPTTPTDATLRSLAIAFGILFFIFLGVTLVLLFLQLKKPRRVTHECVPLSHSPGYDNVTFHK